MSEACYPIEELATVASLPEGAPGRRHFDACTRCQSLAVMLREFESPTLDRAAAAFESVDAHLVGAIAELTGIPADAPDHSQATEGGPVARERRPGFSLRPRLAWGFAGLLIAIVAGTLVWRALAPGETMRALPSSPGGAARVFTAEPARETPGGVTLSWEAWPGASAYRIVFFDATLREVAHMGPFAAPGAALHGDALPAGLVSGTTVGWQVEALAGGDRVATSASRTLRVP